MQINLLVFIWSIENLKQITCSMATNCWNDGQNSNCRVLNGEIAGIVSESDAGDGVQVLREFFRLVLLMRIATLSCRI